MLWNAKAKETAGFWAPIATEHGSLGVEAAVRGKRICLFEEMLKHYGYPDLGVVEELKAGASLTGDVTETGMLPFKFTPALLTDDALRVHSALRREQILAEPRGSGDPEVDKAVWDQTLVEKEQGWLRGPIPLENVPSNSPTSRRFGLRQKHKIRLIDDFSESSVNATVSVFESPVLHTVDVACASVMHWFACAKAENMDPSLVARTFDLSSAYRQVGLNPAGRDVALLGFIILKLRAGVFSKPLSCHSVQLKVPTPFYALHVRCGGLEQLVACFSGHHFSMTT